MTINEKLNPGVAHELYRTLDGLANDSSFKIMVGLVPCKEIEDLPMVNGRSVRNRFVKKKMIIPRVGYEYFVEYLKDVAKRRTPVQIHPPTGFVQAEIKKSALRGQEFPLTGGLWYLVADGQVSLYRNREPIEYGDL